MPKDEKEIFDKQMKEYQAQYYQNHTKKLFKKV
jgi:hypothetical protein